MTQPDRRHLRRARLALAVVVAAALAAWLWFPGGRTFLQQSLTALASLDPQQVRGFIAAWGPQAALVSFALMILQGDRRSAAGFPDYPRRTPPCSAPSGAGRCRGSALWSGPGSASASPERWGAKWWRNSPAARCCAVPTAISPALARRRSSVCRLLPFVPFDPVSYAAGLTSLRFWPFMLATGVGQLPATIVYSSGRESAHRGHLLAGHRAFAAFLPSAVVISIAKNIYRERHKRSSP